MPEHYLVRDRAKQNLSEIVDYIAAQRPAAAERFVATARHEFQFLAGHPRAGSIRNSTSPRLAGLRSWPIKGFRNYLIFYLPSEDGIQIVRVLHGPRDVDRIVAAS